MTGRLGVVVVNYSSHQLLAENLVPVDFGELDVEVVVVDNPTSVTELRSVAGLAAANGWHLVANATNVGFGKGMNVGVATAQSLGCSTFLLVNPDLVFDGPVVEAMYAQVSVDENVVVSPRIDGPNGRAWFRGGELDPGTGNVRTSRPVDMAAPFSWLSGACIMISDLVWQRSGGFDSRYFLYWEDVDFSQRCRQVGATLAVRDDLVVRHDVGGTQGAGKSLTYVQYNCRNRLLFASRWLSATDQRSWLRRTPRESYRILRRDGRRALLRPTMVAAAIKGSLRGVKVLRRGLATRTSAPIAKELAR